MSKLSITEAVKIIPVSESTLRRDLKSGKVSFAQDAKGRKLMDVSELERVYGKLDGSAAAGESAEPVNDSDQNLSMNGNDGEKVVALLENQVTDLKAQLAQALDRENSLIREKSKLLDLTDRLQKQNETLMLPPAPEKKRRWIDRLTGR